ncbi:MAG TPA: agmatinase [Anaerohalosphaeraceae bacterium]|nr:agmatinase [Anaerohalosphaeraceae bacterium]HOL89962.1 agmatinase [Anaerohalosphaeraceae bacterium]HPP57134.1 agmatinase [Anaerohalosphaeraceae bacterium]
MRKSSSFGDFEPHYTDFRTAQIVILPVPYDQTSTWIKGADKGPEAILKASKNLEFYDILTDSEVFRKGIATDAPVLDCPTPDEMVKQVRQRMLGYFQKGKFPVLLGGEHSVSIGAFQAAAQSFSNLTVLQLDAHADTREEYEGSIYNHACVMARARQLCPIVQAGIRSMDSCEKPALDKTRVFFAHQIAADPQRRWIDTLLSLLTDNVYLTIDLDVFDPSLMPATGTPEPGGLGWYEVISLIEQVCRHRNVIGMDVVELCPREHLWASDFLAAKLIYQTLSFRFRD